MKAYAKAVELEPQNAGFQAAYCEAMTRAAGETVTPAAKAAFEQALKLDPSEARARYFIGLAMDQQGDKAGALRTWVALLKKEGRNDDWVPELRQRVASLATELGISLDSSVAGQIAAAPVVPDQASAAHDPTADDIKAAEAMPEAERTAMIRRMVEGLAARLAHSPQVSDGWIKLIRSRVMLGEREAAKDALAQALLVFAGAAAEKSRIIDAARELGVAQ